MRVQVELRPDEQDGIQEQAQLRAEAAGGGVGGGAAAAAGQWGWAGSDRDHNRPVLRNHISQPARVGGSAGPCLWAGFPFPRAPIVKLRSSRLRSCSDDAATIKRRRPARSRPARCAAACQFVSPDGSQFHQIMSQDQHEAWQHRPAHSAPLLAGVTPPRAVRGLEQQQQRLHCADLPGLHVAHNLQGARQSFRQEE